MRQLSTFRQLPGILNGILQATTPMDDYTSCIRPNPTTFSGFKRTGLMQGKPLSLLRRPQCYLTVIPRGSATDPKSFYQRIASDGTLR